VGFLTKSLSSPKEALHLEVAWLDSVKAVEGVSKVRQILSDVFFKRPSCFGAYPGKAIGHLPRLFPAGILRTSAVLLHDSSFYFFLVMERKFGVVKLVPVAYYHLAMKRKGDGRETQAVQAPLGCFGMVPQRLQFRDSTCPSSLRSESS
jgi:hypothetical protein